MRVTGLARKSVHGIVVDEVYEPQHVHTIRDGASVTMPAGGKMIDHSHAVLEGQKFTKVACGHVHEVYFDKE